ncbi:VOC family protein [Streptomyces olivochromogenes]|uniref:VOC family protein n=1 Tax=Streptomyces olivochromogenes TaxID=1963 RepID=UPI0036D856FD
MSTTLDGRRPSKVLLYSGPLEKYVSQNATVIVESLTPVLDVLGKAGATILEAPNEVPNGTRIVARHPDGSVFEYMQPRVRVPSAAPPLHCS